MCFIYFLNSYLVFFLNICSLVLFIYLFGSAAHTARGILVPPPGIPPAVEGGSLTAGPPGKFIHLFLDHNVYLFGDNVPNELLERMKLLIYTNIDITASQHI